jgi:hypothetical protein
LKVFLRSLLAAMDKLASTIPKNIRDKLAEGATLLPQKPMLLPHVLNKSMGVSVDVVMFLQKIGKSVDIFLELASFCTEIDHLAEQRLGGRGCVARSILRPSNSRFREKFFSMRLEIFYLRSATLASNLHLASCM